MRQVGHLVEINQNHAVSPVLLCGSAYYVDAWVYAGKCHSQHACDVRTIVNDVLGRGACNGIVIQVASTNTSMRHSGITIRRSGSLWLWQHLRSSRTIFRIKIEECGVRQLQW